MNKKEYILISFVIFIGFLFLGSKININYSKNFSQSEQIAQQNKLGDFLVVGEELNYEVSYTFIKLGSIKMKVTDKYYNNGRAIYKTISYIDSYNIPLVSLHNVFESEIDEDMFSHKFLASELINKDWRYTKYILNYSKNRAFMEKGYASRNYIEMKDTADLKNKKHQDGLSLFFYARAMLYSQKSIDIPVLMNEKSEITTIKYPCWKDKVDISAVDYPVDVMKFEGRADWVGILGLTGGFSGCFSNDNARIPIVARMNVILGSIYLELKSWNRPGWAPPRANN